MEAEPSVRLPRAVRACWDLALQVKPISRDPYAVQLRKTLETICRRSGASDHLPSGKRAQLWQQIDELRAKKKVSEFIAQAASELRDISNSGAHYCAAQVSASDIRKLERLLELICEYVYGKR